MSKLITNQIFGLIYCKIFIYLVLQNTLAWISNTAHSKSTTVMEAKSGKNEYMKHIDIT